MTAIFLPRSSTKKGFSLLELLIVVAIIAIITAFALPAVTSIFKISLRSATRELASTIKETYHSTIVTGRIHRIVYDLDKSEFWVEVGPPGFLLHTQETLEKENEFKKYTQEKTTKKEFNLDQTITRKKIALPSGVGFESIETEESETPISEGFAYTHFFPHGVSEQVVIHMRDLENHQTTLWVFPTSGKTKVYNHYIELKDILKQ